MKTLLKCSMALLMVIGFSTLALARGTANVSNTVHNMSVSGPFWSFYTTAEEQVCIFCHTPHGGSLTGPLWNRADPTSTWSFYSSSTLTTEVSNVAALNDESLLCLSCHDGSIGVNEVLNYGALNPISAVTMPIVGTATPGARIGGDAADTNDVGQLDDDHPISFSYQAVYTETGGVGFNDPTGMTSDIRFFGGAALNVECSTCHDPHVDYESDPTYAPFLNMSNAGSALCLACHDK